METTTKPSSSDNSRGVRFPATAITGPRIRAKILRISAVISPTSTPARAPAPARHRQVSSETRLDEAIAPRLLRSEALSSKDREGSLSSRDLRVWIHLEPLLFNGCVDTPIIGGVDQIVFLQFSKIRLGSCESTLDLSTQHQVRCGGAVIGALIPVLLGATAKLGVGRDQDPIPVATLDECLAQCGEALGQFGWYQRLTTKQWAIELFPSGRASLVFPFYTVLQKSGLTVRQQ